MTQAQDGKTRIVVGADLSETGDNAIRQAVALARQIGSSELHVTHVIVSAHDLRDQRLEALGRELPAKLEQLRKHVSTLCAPGADESAFKVECVFHIRLGNPAHALHQVAVDVDADLIVVGTHGRTGVEKLLLGSVAQELMTIARVSVLVAHPNRLHDLTKTARIEPPRPGAELTQTGLSSHVHLEFVPRTAHISGLL